MVWHEKLLNNNGSAGSGDRRLRETRWMVLGWTNPIYFKKALIILQIFVSINEAIVIF